MRWEGVADTLSIMRLDVQYISQLTDIHDEYWTNRACGGVSLAMVLAYHQTPIENLLVFLGEAKRDGGFTQEKGWFYVYLESAAKRVGHHAHVEDPTTIENLISHLDHGEPVIISVVKRLFGKERGHILVVTGYKKDREHLEGFYYNDPESLYMETGKDQYVKLSDFENDWKKRALYISPQRDK